MSDASRQAHEALVLRLRLEFGLVSLEEIENWADAWLWVWDQPPDALVDLSMARMAGVHESAKLLRALGGEHVMPGDVLSALASADTGKLSPEQLGGLMHIAWRWASEFDEQRRGDPVSADRVLLWQALTADDLVYPARHGQIPWSDVRAAAETYLREVREFVAAERKGAGT